MIRERRCALLLFTLSLTALLAACGTAEPNCEDTDCGSGGTSSTSTTSGAGGATGTGGSAPTTFPCKTEVCSVGTEQCAIDGHDVGGCFPLPKACIAKEGAPPPTCACFTDLTADCTCFQDTMGNFVVQCTAL
jgi:hypothetical protein